MVGNTGRIRSEGDLGWESFTTSHLMEQVGDLVFAGYFTGITRVATLTPKPALIAVNSLGDGGAYSVLSLKTKDQRGYSATNPFNYGSQRFFSGNRMFTTSFTHLYCVGNPKEPLRLSTIHEKKYQILLGIRTMGKSVSGLLRLFMVKTVRIAAGGCHAGSIRLAGAAGG